MNTQSDCKFCRTTPNAGDPSCCQSLEQAYEQTSERPYGCPWFDQEDRKHNPKSAVPEPVRDAQCTLDPLSRAAAIARELRRFHRNACYPDAMDSEINETMQRIAALSAAQCAPQPSGEQVAIRILTERHKKLAGNAENPQFTEQQREIWAALANEKLDDIRAINAAPPAVSCAAREALEKTIQRALLDDDYFGNRSADQDQLELQATGSAVLIADAILSLPAAGGEASKREAEIVERCAKAVEAQAVGQDGEPVSDPTDISYNFAIDHAAAAVRALASIPDERGGIS